MGHGIMYFAKADHKKGMKLNTFRDEAQAMSVELDRVETQCGLA